MYFLSSYFRNFALAAFCLTLLSSLSFAGTPLSVRDYIAVALTTNETTRINDAQRAQFEAKTDQAAATMMPQVKLIASHTRQEAPAGTSISNSASAARLNLTQPLLGLYKNRAAITAAQDQLTATSAAGDDTVLQLKMALSDAFHVVLSAIGDVRSYQEVRDVAAKRVKETSARVKIGKSRPADLYSAEAQLAAAEAQWEQAKTAEGVARNNLAQLSGLPADTALLESASPPESPGPIANFLSSTDKLPAFKALAAQKTATAAQVEATRAQRIPDLDLFANYYLKREAPLDKVRWDIGAQLTWSIYDGGLTSGRVADFQSQESIFDYQLNQKQRVVTAKIRQYHQQYTAILTQIPILEKSLNLAQKSYGALEKDYRLGLSSILEVIQSFNAVADAKRQYQHQIITAKSTYSALKLNAGQTL